MTALARVLAQLAAAGAGLPSELPEGPEAPSPGAPAPGGLGLSGASVRAAESQGVPALSPMVTPPETGERAALDRLCERWRLVLASELRTHARACFAQAGRPAPPDVRKRHAKRVAAALAAGRSPPALGWSWAQRARWYLGRAYALERPWTDRANECGSDYLGAVALACMACAWQGPRPVSCGLVAWCNRDDAKRCGRRYRGRVYKRLVDGLRREHGRELAAWRAAGFRRGKRPSLTLVTLTVRHSGSIAQDRKTIQRGWERLRAWLHLVDGRALPFALAWELTPGRDGLGHVHAHVATLWPFRDLRALDAEWSRATDGQGVNVDVLSASAAKRKGKIRTAEPGAAASYIAHYVDAGGVDPSTPLAMQAEWLRMLRRGARRYSTSEGLCGPPARPECPDCEERCVVSLGFRKAHFWCEKRAIGPPGPEPPTLAL